MSRPLFIHASGPDPGAIAARLAHWPWFADAPVYLEIDERERPVTPDWREQVAGATLAATADWDRDAGPADAKVVTLLQPTPARSGIVLAAAPAAFTRAEEVLDLLADVPFELASFRTLWPAEWKKLDAPRLGFGQQHAVHGWACAFRGAGHDRLVSRRWLDHGPWRLLRGAGDLTLVQFHDLDAAAKQALAQAIPAHARMGIADTGGFIQAAPTGDKVEGLYDAETRTLEVVVAGRPVSQAEMLAACAVRRARRADPDKPIERIAYVFVSDTDARAHCHELWLRELECWSVDGGSKRRLDVDHHPEPAPPAWVSRR
jgi:hypothetical protein